MKNRVFKVIGRFKERKKQKSWSRGIPGRQAKKRVYTSYDDFKKYSVKTIKRYKETYDVEVYELIGGEWLQWREIR